jgi:hypothetical protein
MFGADFLGLGLTVFFACSALVAAYLAWGEIKQLLGGHKHEHDKVE